MESNITKDEQVNKVISADELKELLSPKFTEMTRNDLSVYVQRTHVAVNKLKAIVERLVKLQAEASALRSTTQVEHNDFNVILTTLIYEHLIKEGRHKVFYLTPTGSKYHTIDCTWVKKARENNTLIPMVSLPDEWSNWSATVLMPCQSCIKLTVTQKDLKSGKPRITPVSLGELVCFLAVTNYSDKIDPSTIVIHARPDFMTTTDPNTKKTYTLELDIFLPLLNFAIEFQGEHHKSVVLWDSDKNRFIFPKEGTSDYQTALDKHIRQVNNDKLKVKFCELHKVKLCTVVGWHESTTVDWVGKFQFVQSFMDSLDTRTLLESESILETLKVLTI